MNIEQTATEVKPTRTWKTEAGPIQSKKVRGVLQAISSQHNTRKEKWGVIGGEEHEMCFFSPFGGGTREDVTAAWDKLGEQFNWTITRENFKQVESAALAALATLRENIPVDDKRKTPEQDATDNAAMREAQSKRVTEANRKRDAMPQHLLEAWEGCAESFRTELREIARKAGKPLDWVYTLWRKYASECQASDQSALVSEFQEWNKAGLTPEARITVRNRGHLRELVEAGRVELVGSYHFDDMMGQSGHKGAAMPCAIKPADWKDRKEGICYLCESEFTGNCGRWSQGDGNRGTLYVHSNCNYDLHILPAPVSAETPEASTGESGIIVRKNEEHNGVEIQFPDKPSPEVIARCKAAGFRWSFHSKVWYKKYGAYAWAQAHTIAGLPLPGERDPGEQTIPVEQSQGVDRFDADIEDRNAELCGLTNEREQFA